MNFYQRGRFVTLLAVSFIITACGADTGARPAVEIRTVTKRVEVAKPCPAKVPDRPAKLTRPLPTDSVALAALLGAKLLEFNGPGGFADRAIAALALCTKVTP